MFVWALTIAVSALLAHQLLPGDGASVPQEIGERPKGKIIAARSRKDLKVLFDAQSYFLSDVRAAKQRVPRLYLSDLPDDLREEKNIGLKKSLFIRAVLPLILRTNESILADRARVIALAEKLERGEAVIQSEVAWLSALSQKYGFSFNDPEQLLVRLDVIPVSLALAQSIQESGWGTSRFALEGNALFGQRTWSSESKGIVPEAIEEGATFKVKSFSKLYDSIKAYAHNLNTNASYQRFRERRAALRRSSQASLSGYDLSGALLAYSEEAEDYVSAIQVVIKSNRLEDFDRAKLSEVNPGREPGAPT